MRGQLKTSTTLPKDLKLLSNISGTIQPKLSSTVGLQSILPTKKLSQTGLIPIERGMELPNQERDGGVVGAASKY